MCIPPPDSPSPWRSHLEADWVVGQAVVHARAGAVVEQARLHALRLADELVEARIREEERARQLALADVVPAEDLPAELRDERVDLNSASSSELQTLPRIGPAMAERVIGGRPYSRVEDLLRVSGIGPATLERIAPLVRVGRSPGPVDGRPEVEGSGGAVDRGEVPAEGDSESQVSSSPR